MYRRRLFRWAIVLVAAAVLGPLVGRAGRLVLDRLSLLRWQSQALAYSLPRDRLCYTEWKEETTLPLRLPGLTPLLSIAGEPPSFVLGCWAVPTISLLRVMPSLYPPGFTLRPGSHLAVMTGWGDVFVHERRSVSGRRLVHVMAVAPARQYPHPSSWASCFYAVVIEPGSLSSKPRRRYAGWLPCDPLMTIPFGSLRLYPGQPDPDASHFTIVYQTRDGRGIIDGWLQSDDSIKLQVRDGPAAGK